MVRSGRAVWRRFIAGLCAGLLAFQVGCYSYLPLQDIAPQAGARVAVTLNDQGRQLVGGRLGAEVDRVDGTMVSETEASVTLSVTRVLSMRGSSSVWSGEQVEIPREGIRGFQERQLSKGRTVMLAAGLLAGLVAVAGLISLTVPGGTDSSLPPGCPPFCGPEDQ